MDTTVDQHIAKEVAKILLSINAVSINVNKPFRYVSGMLAPLYTDNRLLISHPKEWNVVMGYFEDVVKKFKSIECLSGTAMAAIPHAAVLASRLSIPMVYVRSLKKEHGKENLIEGEFPPESKVLIIEDLVSTGSSVEKNVQAIRQAKGIVTECVAITTSTVHAFEKIIQDLQIHLTTLTNIQTIVDVAKQLHQISQEEYNTIQLFLTDPPNWGKQTGRE